MQGKCHRSICYVKRNRRTWMFVSHLVLFLSLMFQVFEWFQSFKEVREMTEHDARPLLHRGSNSLLWKGKKTVNGLLKESLQDPLPGQSAIPSSFACEGVLGKAQQPRVRSSTVLVTLSPVDHFWTYLFPKVKSQLKGTQFQRMESVKAKATQTIKKLTKGDLQQCYAQWKKILCTV